MNLPQDISFAAGLTDPCDGNCQRCGLYQPHKEETCRGTEKMGELEKEGIVCL